MYNSSRLTSTAIGTSNINSEFSEEKSGDYRTSLPYEINNKFNEPTALKRF